MLRKNTVAIPRNRPSKLDQSSSSSSSSPSSSSSSTTLTDDIRWQLVLSRAPTTTTTPASGSFFLYGVISTGIFCLTSCPSRRPRRANARFFDSAAAATAAGFRACLRCRPGRDETSFSPSSSPSAVDMACEYVRRRAGEVQLLDIAAHVGLSPRYLHGLFKKVLGTTPGAYAAAVRQKQQQQQQQQGQQQGQRHQIADVVPPELDSFVTVDPKEDDDDGGGGGGGGGAGGPCDMSFPDFDWESLLSGTNIIEYDSACAVVDDSTNPEDVYAEWIDDDLKDMIESLSWPNNGDSFEPLPATYLDSPGCMDSLLSGS